MSAESSAAAPAALADAPPIEPGLPPATLRYFAWLYAGPAERARLGVLVKIETEIATSLRAGMDHHVAHTRLEWWADECERFREQRPAHPLTKELLRIQAPSAAWRGPEGLVSTATWDLAGAPFDSRRELANYCSRWAAAMFPREAVLLGAAVREIEMLFELALDARAGRLRVPLDELDRAGVAPESLARRPWPEPLAALIRKRLQDLRFELATAQSALSNGDALNRRGVLVWTALAERLSRRIEGALPDIARPRRFDTMTDAWAAWRAARRVG